MTAPHLVDPGRSIDTRGFSRLRYGLVLGAIAVAVAVFMWATLNAGHGLYAVIVLSLCAVALAFWGGPERLARRITVSDEGLHIDRFHRVRTVIDWTELTAATARSGTTSRGRPGAELVLEPADPVTFFFEHRELRAVRAGDLAVVPAGSAAQTVTELNAAFDALAHEALGPRPTD